MAVKAALRKEMKGRLRGLVGEERREQSQALVAKLLQLPAYKEARCRHLHLHLHLLQVGVPVPEPGHGGGHCGPGLPGAAGGQEVLRPQVGGGAGRWSVVCTCTPGTTVEGGPWTWCW